MSGAVRDGAVTLLVVLATITVGPEARAQAFAVSSFTPWAGYSIPNGEWLTGDFGGDGKVDVFHAVASGDYAHVWTSAGTGSFTMSTFQPWPGYSIPNGVWLSGDFDADGKGDILHAVASGDYAHVWTATTGGAFSVTTFRPWPGYAIPNGVWLAGDFAGDSKADVFHAVASGDYAHLWTSTGGGNFTVATFRPWPGYSIPNGVWRAGDYNGDGKADVLHAVASGDYAHIWLSKGNGTFDVQTFRPWTGYSIPNGQWLSGDFNADGKWDVFHAVASGGYAHVWLSTGAGTFDVKTFQPWPGYAIPNGVWLAADVDRDGRTDVVHAVANTDYANIWRSTGTGTFAMRSFSPWAGYAIPNGVWRSGDLDGDGKGDLFHAVASGGYAHAWRSVLPGPNEVALDGLEVTQAIQNMDHTVTLVANKATWVRAYLSSHSTAPMTVTGTLRARNVATGATTTIASTASTTLDPAQYFQLRPKRESITGSLNFVVPAGHLVAGQEEFRVTAVTAGGSAVPCSNCTAGERTVSFTASSPMRVRVVGIQYTSGTPPSTVLNTPSAADLALTQSWIGRAYPTGQLISSQAIVNATNAWPFDCAAANAQLTAMRNNEIANNTVDNRTHYAGLVSVGGGYMTGCAAGIPGTVASSPTGNPATGTRPINVTGDVDASFGDWYTGHELGHSYGRFHPGFCNNNSANDPNFPNPNGQISDNEGTFTGLDVGDATNAITPAVLPGASRFDIMTYCNQPQWLSAYAYEGVRARLNAENPAGTGAPSGGARAMTASRLSASEPIDPDCGCERPAKPALRGPPAMRVGRSAPLLAKLAMEGAPALPQAAREREPSPPRGILARFDSTSVRPALRVPAEVERGFVARRTPWEVQRSSQATRVRVGDFLNVVATVNVTRNSATIMYINRIRRAEVPSAVNDVRASVRLVDQNDRVLVDQRVELREITDREPGEDRLAIIDAVVPFDASARRVEIVLSGRVVATRATSARRLVISSPRASTMKMQAVPSDTSIATLDLAWDIAGADSGSVTYTVETSPLEETRWTTVAIGWRTPSITLIRAQFAEHASLRVRITANDGFNQSAPVTLVVRRP